MSYYAKNPYEQPEPPRCLYCDEFLSEFGFGHSFRWECHNPACEDCASNIEPPVSDDLPFSGWRPNEDEE